MLFAYERSNSLNVRVLRCKAGGRQTNPKEETIRADPFAGQSIWRLASGKEKPERRVKRRSGLQEIAGGQRVFRYSTSCQRCASVRPAPNSWPVLRLPGFVVS